MGAVKNALKTSGMSIDEVKKVIMFGGGQRVPSVQEALRKELGDKLELSFSINSDEAAALGGSYQGAYVTKFFRVQTIWVKDAALEPISVHFERVVDPAENDGKSIKEVKRALFQVMNPYPQKKAVTFNRFTEDFNFTMHIGDNLASATQLKGVKVIHPLFAKFYFSIILNHCFVTSSYWLDFYLIGFWSESILFLKFGTLL